MPGAHRQRGDGHLEPAAWIVAASSALVMDVSVWCDPQRQRQQRVSEAHSTFATTPARARRGPMSYRAANATAVHVHDALVRRHCRQTDPDQRPGPHDPGTSTCRTHGQLAGVTRQVSSTTSSTLKVGPPHPRRSPGLRHQTVAPVPVLQPPCQHRGAATQPRYSQPPTNYRGLPVFQTATHQNEPPQHRIAPTRRAAGRGRRMALDWSRIGGGTQDPLLRPRDIFAALPNRPWPYLRAEQGEVLEGWFRRLLVTTGIRPS